jgi:NADH-quinone oxidoreductase subunit G
VAERYGSIRRIYSRYNGQVNGYFLCDRGRFGYEYVNSDLRLKHFLIKQGSSQQQIEKTSALELVKKAISGGKVIGIGSPRASLEANFALKRLVGAENFSVGISETELRLNKLGLEILSKGNVRTPSLREVEDCDAVFLLGEDVTQTAPMLALALRQSAKNTPREKAHKAGIPQWQDSAVKEIVQHDRGPFYIANTSNTRLDDIATARYTDTPDSIAQLGNAVGHFIDEAIDLPKKMSEVQCALAKKIAHDLLNAAKPLIVSGIHSMHEGIMKATANIAWALKKKGKDIGISLTFRESNSVGISMMDGKSLNDVFELIEKNEKYTVIILENDLYRRLSKTRINTFLDSCENVISLDHSQHKTTLKSTIVLPAGTFAETDGTFVNNEGRAQRFYQVLPPNSEINESWRLLAELDKTNERLSTLTTFEDFARAVEEESPYFVGIGEIAPSSDFKMHEMKIAREPHRYSGRTAMKANVNVHEQTPPVDFDAPMTFTMEGYQGEPPSSLIPFYWSPGWNSAQAINKYQIEVGGPLHGGDPGRRLIEPSEKGMPYFTVVNLNPVRKQHEWLTVPIYHIFGSEEFSPRSPAIMERISPLFISLNPKDAQNLDVEEGDEKEIVLDGQSLNMKVKIINEMESGTIGLPAGFPSMPYWEPGILTITS